MQTKKPHIILSIFLSALFLIGGTGYNVVHYCCDDCKNAGINKVAEMSCASIHETHCHDENTDHEHCAKSGECDNLLHKSCGIERLVVDTPSMQKSFGEMPDYSLLAVDLDADFLVEMAVFAETTIQTELNHSPPEIYFPHKGRTILCQKSVLII